MKDLLLRLNLSGNSTNHIVELLVCVALAVAHRQLGVDQPASERDLESTSPAIRLRFSHVELAAKLVAQEAIQAVCKPLVRSAAAELDAHG
eukprot:CAMPEP_0119373770 /NCGR_PEP_ID=MMETSP1334-20130426/27828_1 /TAXON_ID=127549 /ORGANISM="Calcidiscus leptoporus, Strain RCC1130" /LENGTH=90 /DNA_ID=CAMNT_0007391641 /DNA_START=394 /DNA_END=666 /DNA_ORIENTATION=-